MRVCILAGSYAQAKEYAGEQGLTDWKYLTQDSLVCVDRIDDLRVVGKPADRPDYDEVRDALLVACGIKI